MHGTQLLKDKLYCVYVLHSCRAPLYIYIYIIHTRTHLQTHVCIHTAHMSGERDATEELRMDEDVPPPPVSQVYAGEERETDRESERERRREGEGRGEREGERMCVCFRFVCGYQTRKNLLACSPKLPKRLVGCWIMH